MGSTLRRKSDSIRKDSGKGSDAFAHFSANSTLACQVQATNVWRKDLKRLADNAREMFADVSWSSGDGEDASLSNASTEGDEIIWAHKAILYARAPNTFQAKFLQLRAPSANLGTLASSSIVSLPAFRTPSPSLSLQSASTSASKKRSQIRGPAPPSSFLRSKASSRDHSSLDSGDSSIGHTKVLKSGSKVSLVPSNISRPITREERRLAKQSSSDTVSSFSTTLSTSCESDALSAISSSSTIKAPISLNGINRHFFEAALEYLYTAEENIKETFEFLYEDKIAAEEGPEERLEKLRQDMVFMWRSRLYFDVQIIIGEEEDEEENPTLRLIPDATASVISLATILSGVPDEQEEKAIFSAHRMMLASRSPYFATQLLGPYADQDTRIIRLPSPPFTPAALHFTLGFIYTGTLFFSNRTFDLSTAFQIWRSASYLQITTLSNLVSNLVENDFCHDFNCSPPCKTCIRRVPRTLLFASSPDVNDERLISLARGATSGPNFGTYWSKEVGNLDYAIRGMLVSQVCSKVDTRAGYSVHVLRQLSIISSRLGAERSSRWVDSIRWMCETVESHLHATIECKFAEIIASTEWQSLIQGVGFLHDVLEKVLSILVDGLVEKRAAKIYEVLVGQVLLREDNPLPSESIAIVEKARLDMLKYLRKRWVNIRANAGFDGLKLWALKEIADEIDIPFNDLLLSADTKMRGPLSRTGLQARPSADREVSSRIAIPFQPTSGKMIDGEREPGPIHLRAAVLNRNAARSTARQASTPLSSSPATIKRVPSSSSSIMDRPRRSLGPVNVSNGAVHDTRSEASQSRNSLVTSQPSIDQGTSTKLVNSKNSNASTVGAHGVLPILNLPSDDEDSVSVEMTPTKAQFDASVRNGETSKSTGQMKPVKSISRSASGSTLRATPVTTSRFATSSASIQNGKARQSSTLSNKAPATAPRRPSVSSTKSLDKNSAKILRKASSTTSITRKKEKMPAPPLPKPSSAILKDATQSTVSNAMQVDGREEFKGTLQTPIGLKLSSGIACVIAPRNKAGHAIRFKATVKYIGPLIDDIQGKPMIGVEVPYPLPLECKEDQYLLHDGLYQGVRYFDIDADYEDYQDGSELSHKPERKARQVRIAQMMQGRAESPMNIRRCSVKRRKDLSGAGLDSSALSSRGLFILPSEVLWVVV